MGQSCCGQHDDDQKPCHEIRKNATVAIDAAPIDELAATNTTMQLISQTVAFRGLPHSLTVLVAQRLLVHPQQLFTVPALPVHRSLTAELIAGSEYVNRDAGRSG